MRAIGAVTALAVGTLACAGCRHARPERSAPERPALIYETEDCDAVQIYRTVDWPDVPKDCKAVEPYGDWKEGDRERVAAFLESVGPQLDQYVRAARAKRCEWTYSKLDFDTELPHLARARKGAKLLASRARVALETGRPGDAVRDIEAIYKIGADMLHDRTLVSGLVGIAIQGVGNSVLRRTEILSHMDSGLLRDFQIHIARIKEQYPPTRHGLECDAQMSKQALEWFISDGFAAGWAHITDSKGLFGPTAESRDPLTRKIHGTFDRIIAHDRERARLIIGQRFEEHCSSAIDRACALACPTLDRWPPDSWTRVVTWKAAMLVLSPPKAGESIDDALNTIGDYLFCLLGGAWFSAARAYAKASMGLEAVLVACKAELYHNEHGTYPAAIEELCNPPMDAFDGAPLKYRRLEGAREGFIVSSAGPKKDWEQRIADLQTCSYDERVFQALSEDHCDSLRFTIWIARRR